MNWEYFFITSQIVAGILWPIMLAFVLSALKDGVQEWCSNNKYQREKKDFFASQNWVFLSKEQPPNPGFISLTFRHLQTDSLLHLGIKKSELSESKGGGSK